VLKNYYVCDSLRVVFSHSIAGETVSKEGKALFTLSISVLSFGWNSNSEIDIAFSSICDTVTNAPIVFSGNTSCINFTEESLNFFHNLFKPLHLNGRKSAS